MYDRNTKIAIKMVMIFIIIVGCLTFKSFFIDSDIKTVTEKVYLEYFDNNVTVEKNGFGYDKYYLVYEEVDDGGKKLSKFKAEDTIIYETLEENEKPYAEIKKEANNSKRIIEVKVYIPKN